MTASSPAVVELRQYALRPGRRQALIDLFERRLIEPQEADGMHVIGQFADVDDPDRFVWLRGFDELSTRAESLARFYDGPVWRANRDEANATMVDSDDVLLLRPARRGSGFAPTRGRARPTMPERGRGAVTAAIAYLDSPEQEPEAVELFEAEIVDPIRDLGGSPLAYLVSEPGRNDFPRLPVREDERVLAWFAGFAEPGALESAASGLERLDATVARSLELTRRVARLRLAPTPRSFVHGRTAPCSAMHAVAR